MLTYLVFLRVLDYYTGILFLTTNRSGALDEAFKSRIHFKIYYPPLTKEQTLDIWRLNITRLRRINERHEEKRPLEIFESTVLNFAEVQFEESNRRGAGQWNGRQIRNAFQVARSLAYFDALSRTENLAGSNEPPRPAVLDVKYFRMMHDITEDFDHYMLAVYGGMNDKALALELEHRADDWTSNRYRRAWPERDEQYNDFAARSPFDTSSRNDAVGRPRSTSFKGGRPSLTAPGPSQRYTTGSLPPSLSAGYDESGIDDRSAGVLPPLSPNPGIRRTTVAPEGSNREFREQLPLDGDFSYQGSSTSPRLGPGLGSSEPRSFRRSGGGYSLDRESRSQSEFDSNLGYRAERNEHGKRERS